MQLKKTPTQGRIYFCHMVLAQNYFLTNICCCKQQLYNNSYFLSDAYLQHEVGINIFNLKSNMKVSKVNRLKTKHEGTVINL